MVIEIIILDLIIPGTGLVVGGFVLVWFFGVEFFLFVLAFLFAVYCLPNTSLSSTKNPDTLSLPKSITHCLHKTF